MSVFASSGDNGAFFGLIYPSASPEVVSVGGTSLFLNANNHVQQRGRASGVVGSGGGYSQAFAIPPYQQNDGFAGNNGQRTNPDVSADADPNTGVAVYDPFDFGTATPWDAGRRHQPGDAAAGPAWPRSPTRAACWPAARRWAPTAMLTDLYNLANIAPGDFHDITSGQQRLLRRARATTWSPGSARPRPTCSSPTCPPTAWPASRPSSPSRRPPSSRATPSASSPQATDSLGVPDPTYTGTATLSLVSGPAGATFTPVTVPVGATAWRSSPACR